MIAISGSSPNICIFIFVVMHSSNACDWLQKSAYIYKCIYSRIMNISTRLTLVCDISFGILFNITYNPWDSAWFIRIVSFYFIHTKIFSFSNHSNISRIFSPPINQLSPFKEITVMEFCRNNSFLCRTKINTWFNHNKIYCSPTLLQRNLHSIRCTLCTSVWLTKQFT